VDPDRDRADFLRHGPPIPPAYTQDELAERCVRTGGWWHGVPPDSLFSGFCEYSSPGILR